MKSNDPENTELPPLRMARDESNLPPPLLNWPPEEPHKMPEFAEVKSYGFYKFLFLVGLAFYFYLKLHGR